MSIPFHLKYRPSTWDELVGHAGTVKSIRGALESGRARSFLLVGDSGVGKTTIARIMATELGIDLDSGEYQEFDGASRTGVDDMRAIKEKLKFKPLNGGKRVVCIDECQKLSTNAWDSMLKIVEEPPPGVYFVFATTNPTKVPKAIRTRCLGGGHELGPLNEEEIGEVIQNVIEEEELEVADDVFQQICESAEGSAREGLVLLSSIVGLSDRGEIMQLIGLRSGEKGNAGDLCRLLNSGGDFKGAMKIVAGMKDETAEGTRHVVLAWFEGQAIRAKNKGQAVFALRVIEAFYEPYPGGIGKRKFPLVASLGQVLLGDN